jgi:sugar/nucleoside kinase (ribokinase family)
MQTANTLHKDDNKDTTTTTTTTTTNNNNNTVVFNRPDIMLIDRENTTAPLFDIAVPLTLIFSNLTQKITK